MIAAGLHGIDNELELEPAYEGNAYDVRQTARTCRTTCTTRATCSPSPRSLATRSARTSSTTT